MNGNAHLRARTKYARTGEWKPRFSLTLFCSVICNKQIIRLKKGANNRCWIFAGGLLSPVYPVVMLKVHT